MRRRPFAFVGGLVLAGIVVGALAAVFFPYSPSFPPSRLIGWRFQGTPRFDPTTAGTTTVIPISVDWLTCAPQDDSWLAPPQISYTSSSVTITMHTNDSFAAMTTCGGGNAAGAQFGIMLDVGIPVAVQLREPLGGRALFDGASPSPAARPYP